ncbi:MFS transporter [Pseudarthrobacter enclensis]|uniref:MFS transporter n=1 Tax=Pseudarthrobacter enclensis TaxID=993070 RepID=UPI003EE2DD21
MAPPLRSETSTLLGAQLVFNVGFYAVVPFLTSALSGEYGMGAAAVGLILGARTFSQQGMFLVGGMLADHWGPKRSILLGCLVRIAGYVTLALATDFSLFLLGAVLTGAGGALFSPALESQLSRADGTEQPQSGKRRSVFVWLALTGEFGALVGPLIGAALLGWGFDAALAFGTGIFCVVTLVLWFRLPASPRPKRQTGDGGGRRTGLAFPEAAKDRRFFLFCVLVSVNMVAYNQLYFTIPLELNRLGLGEAWLAGLFLLASVLTLLLQLPVAAGVQRLGEARAMSVGFVLLALAFVLAATASTMRESGVSAVVILAAAVGLLILGHMSLTPTILSVIPRFLRSGTAGRGAYYGLAATCGGVGVLLANGTLGFLQSTAGQAGWEPGLSLLLLVALAAAASAVLPFVVPSESAAIRVGTRARTAAVKR